MGQDLTPYKERLRKAKANLEKLLASGEGTVDEVAMARGTYDLLEYHLGKYPNAVLKNYGNEPPDPEYGLTGADLWWLHAYRETYRELSPHRATDEGKQMYRDRRQEYLDLALRVVEWPSAPPQRVEDRVSGTVYLVRPNRELVKKAAPAIASELLVWFDQHPMSPKFLKKKAEDGWWQFLAERPDINAIIRFIDDEVPDVTTYYDPDIVVKPSIAEAIIELAIGLIPVIGSIVAAYEAYRGTDLFGNPLDTLDRTILASSVFLAAVGRFVEGGRAVYSETGLVQMCGREAADWERAVEAAGRIDADTLRALGRAEEALRLQGKIEAGLAKEAARVLPNVPNPAGLPQTAVEKEIADAFRELRQSHPIMETLDDFAIRRIVAKGPNVDHIKGQLLEELIESRLVPWLLDRAGSAALGFQFTGKHLVFIPGHMIRDAAGRQITDGVLGIWHEGELVIGAIFEAKAGRYAARELSFAGGSISKLTKAQRAELRAVATEVQAAQQARATLAGEKYTKTIEDVEKEVIQSERGGQVRRDIERLSEDVDGIPARIYIGDMPQAVAVRVSPTQTRFMGLLPKDAGRKTIERQLRDEGFSFEIIGVDMTSKQLKKAAETLKPIAEKLTGSME